MGKRYHYDKWGKYIGHSDNKPPGDDTPGCVIFFCILLVAVPIVGGGIEGLTGVNIFEWLGDFFK
jgi:hypothetical protein